MKMKKIVLLFVVLFGISQIKTSAAEALPNWEYYPLGYNYFDDTNFEFIQGNPINYGTVRCLNYIKVKSNLDYMINMYDYQNGKIVSVSIKGYDKNKSSMHTITPTRNEKGEDVYFTFHTTSNTTYIKIEMNVMEEYGANLQLHRVEYNYSMIEGTDYNLYSSLNLNDLKYKGPDVPEVIVPVNKVGYYTTNVNDPITLDRLKSSIVAMDDFDGDITANIEVTKDNYSTNKNKVGTYEIVFYIVDSSLNATNFTMYVTVEDTTSPVITGTNYYETDQSTFLSVDDIKNTLQANDNVDGNITSKITIKNDGYSQNKSEVASHKIVFEVVDSSNNSTEYIVTVKVVFKDNQAPTITGTFDYEIDNNQVLTVESILSNLKANDLVDGDLSSKIKVEYDYYSHAPSRVGTWKIGVYVQDASGNRATKEITVVVKDKTSPVFLIKNEIVNINISDVMEISDFINMLEKTNSVKKNLSYKIVEDEYSENKKTPGTYKVVLDVEGEELELNINVFESLEVENLSFFERIVWFFKDIFYNITSFFKRIF